MPLSNFDRSHLRRMNRVLDSMGRIQPMLKKVWGDPVWSAVISTGIISAIVATFAYMSGYVSTIVGWFGILWAFILASSSVPNWMLGIGVLLAFATVTRIVVLAWSSVDEGPALPGWRSYKRDSFFGVVWAWDYGSNGQLVDIHSLCPQCQCQIVPRYEDRWPIDSCYHFECDACGYKGEEVKGCYEEIVNKIIRFSQRKIRTGDWKTVSV